MRRFLKLHNVILVGILLGILAGWLVSRSAEGGFRTFSIKLFDTLGYVFISLLISVMIPLVVSSLIGGMLAVGDPRKLGRIGAKTIGYYMVTTVLAITIGLVVVNAIRPGRWVTPETKQNLEKQYGGKAAERKAAAEKVKKEWDAWAFVKSLVPRNPVKSMVADPPEMLPIIVFAILIGLAATFVPSVRVSSFASFIESFTEVMLTLVKLIMYVAPVGAFALIAKVIADSGLGILATLAGYSIAILAALALQFLLVYSLTVWIFARLSPLDFWRGMSKAFLTAFSTSSSAATLPVSLRCVRELGVPAPVANFCLPLGATVNMDGTSIFQAVASVFIAQVYIGDLTVSQQLTILITATLASIGTAPVPGAGIVMLGVIMIPLGIPLEGIALILGVDRFLDMCRTVLNITGDAAGSVMVAATEGEKIRYQPPADPREA